MLLIVIVKCSPKVYSSATISVNEASKSVREHIWLLWVAIFKNIVEILNSVQRTEMHRKEILQCMAIIFNTQTNQLQANPLAKKLPNSPSRTNWFEGLSQFL